MKEGKIFAVGKMAVAVFAVSAAWLFFGAIVPASAATMTCYWTAASTTDPTSMSNLDNWWESNNNIPCANLASNNLLFDPLASTTNPNFSTTTNAVWDVGMTAAQAVTISSTYTGVITVGAASSTIVSFLQYGGTVSTTESSNVFHVINSFVASSSAKWAGVTGMNVTLYNNGDITISTSGIAFYNLVIGSGTRTTDLFASNYTVTTTNDLTVDLGATLALGSKSLSVGGSLLNSGTITQSSAGTVTMTGASAMLGGTGTTVPYDLTIAGTSVTLAGNVTTTNNLIINTGATLAASSHQIALSKDSGTPFVNNGTFTAGTGDVRYAGATSAYIATTTYYNLTIDTDAVLNGNVTTTNIMTLNEGKTVDAATYIVEFTKASGEIVAGTGSFTASTSTLIISGSGADGVQIPGFTAYNLIINAVSSTLVQNVTTTNVLTINSGKTLNLGNKTLVLSGSGTPLVKNGTLNAEGSDVKYTSASSANITSASYYNLIIDTAGTLAGSVTSTNILTINASESLDAATHAIVLSKSSGTPFVITGTFTVNTSTVKYTGSGTVTSTAAAYYNLEFGTGTYFFSDCATSTNSFINGGTTTIWAGKYLYAPVTFDNNGTITENGAIQHPLTSAKITNSAGTETAAFTASSDSVYVTVEDSDGNLDANAFDTITGSVVTAVSLLSDSETFNLTETGVNTGIFRSSALPLTVSSAATTNDGIFEVSFNGNLTLAFVDSKQSSDTGADTATFNASQYTTSGSGSGGGAPADTTPPTNTSVVIAAGAGSTDITAVTLTLAATGAFQMMISNASDFTGSTWETYTTTKTWTLTSGTGIKTVYAKFKDTAGNISAAISDTIDSTATTTVNPPITPPAGSGCPSLAAGDMVKVTGKPAIYAVNNALKIYYFPSGDEFKSWRPIYGGYLSITQTCFDALSVPTSYPAAVNYHPGSYVVKRAASDQLYVVEPGNKLAKITPAVATTLYGTTYTTMTVADPFWPHYVNRGTDIAAAKAHPGMLVKVGDVTYYVDADSQLREITTAGMTANGFQTKFVRTVPASAIEGLTAGVKITAEIKALTDKTQQTVE